MLMTRRTLAVVCSVYVIWSEEETKLRHAKKQNDSTGLKGTGLENRWKAHWDFELGIHLMFIQT